jgi:ankyrin repeat protein
VQTTTTLSPPAADESDLYERLAAQVEPCDEWQDPSGGPLAAAFEACAAGDAQRLLEALSILGTAADLSTPGPDGDTLLHIACLYGSEECAHLLLQHGAQAGTRNQQDGR